MRSYADPLLVYSFNRFEFGPMEVCSFFISLLIILYGTGITLQQK